MAVSAFVIIIRFASLYPLSRLWAARYWRTVASPTLIFICETV